MANPFSIVSAAIVSGDLIIGLSDGGIINAGRVQGPQGLAGPVGPTGANGFAGTDGSTIRSSQGRPAPDLGNEGDFAINTVDIEIFGPKLNHGWGNGTPLRGRVSEAERERNREDERELEGMAPLGPDPMSAVGVVAPIINTGSETFPVIGIATELPGAVLAGVATTGDYNDLTNKPAPFDPNTLATVATTGEYSDLLSKPTLGTAAATASTDYATSAQGIKADTATQPGDLATVATSGSYNDLTDQPTLGTAAATDATAYATAVQGATADAALAAAASNTANISSNTSNIATNTADIATKADLVNGVVATSQIPAIAVTKFLGTVATQAAMLGLTGEEGDFCIRSDRSHAWVITGSDPANINDWVELVTPTSDVTSVNTQTGVVILGASDVGAATTAQGITADSAVQPGDLATVATSGDYADLTNKPTLGTAAATDSTAYATAAQGVTADTAIQPGDLGAVATSNNYNDLNNLPTLGTAAATNATAYATAAQGTKADSATQPGDLSTVATSGSYDDLSNKPSLGTAAATDSTAYATAAQGGLADSATQPGDLAPVATSGDYDDLTNKPTLGTAAATNATAYATAAQGTKADSATQPGDLATVATSGDYGDLANKPTLGTAAATDSTAYATAAQGTKADSATQPGDLSTVATSGDYDDLSNKPTLGTAAATASTAYATAAQGTKADSATQPGDLSTVATSGNYADLSNKPDLSLKADLVNGKLDPLQVPDLAISEYLGEVASEAAMLALTGAEGDWAVRTDNGQVYIITGDDPSDAADWTALSYPASPVSSVAGRTGDVVLSNVDISGLGTAATTAATAYATAAQGTKADSATQPGDLATVATSGDYADLTNKPTLGTAAATDSTAYATAAEGVLAANSIQSVSVTSPLVNTGTTKELVLELATIEGGTY